MSYEFAEPYKHSAEAPDFWLRENDRRIFRMPLNELMFIHPNSIVREKNDDTLSIDANDRAVLPHEVQQKDTRVGLIRILHPVTGRLGYLADMRRATEMQTRTFGSEGFSNETLNRNEANKNEPLLGAVFEEPDTGKLYFMSNREDYELLLPYASSLLSAVDALDVPPAAEEDGAELEATPSVHQEQPDLKN